MKLKYQEPTMTIVKMPNLPMLNGGASGGMEGGSGAPSLDDPESMLPILIIGEE